MIIAWQIIEDGELVAAGTQDVAKVRGADPAQAAWRVADSIERAIIGHRAPLIWDRPMRPIGKVVL